MREPIALNEVHTGSVPQTSETKKMTVETLPFNLQQIATHLTRRQQLLDEIAEQTKQGRSSPNDPLDESVQANIALLGLNEFELVVASNHLSEAISSANHAKPGKDTSAFWRAFKPFQLAIQIAEDDKHSPRKGQLVLSKRGSNGAPGAVARVIFTREVGGVFISLFMLALDMLQILELRLRFQAVHPCESFCQGLHDSLQVRLRDSISLDKLIKTSHPKSLATEKVASKLIVALGADIKDRLRKISRGLEQVSKHQVKMQSHGDEQHRAERELYADELEVLLSELVHLNDNLQTWLKATNQDQNVIKIVEELECYRAASCFVNTRKHGLRGRSAGAFADYEFVVLVEGKPYAFDLLVNFKGKAWAASTLISDLIQIWDVFLKYHVELDLSEFRSSIEKHRLAKVGHVTYKYNLGEAIDNDLAQKASERLRYNI